MGSSIFPGCCRGVCWTRDSKSNCQTNGSFACRYRSVDVFLHGHHAVGDGCKCAADAMAYEKSGDAYRTTVLASAYGDEEVSQSLSLSHASVPAIWSWIRLQKADKIDDPAPSDHAGSQTGSTTAEAIGPYCRRMARSPENTGPAGNRRRIHPIWRWGR